MRKSDVVGLENFGLERVILEVNDNGSVCREIGLSLNGDVVYKFPGHGKFGGRGLFDNAIIDLSELRNDISAAEFNVLFQEQD